MTTVGKLGIAEEAGPDEPRAHRLTELFEQTNAELITFVEQCPDSAWSMRRHHRSEAHLVRLAWSAEMLCAHESWSLGAAVHHITQDVPVILSWGQLAARQPDHMATQLLDLIQAQHANQHAPLRHRSAGRRWFCALSRMVACGKCPAETHRYAALGDYASLVEG